MKALFSSILIGLFVLAPLPSFADVTAACHVVGSEINPTETKATDDFINLVDGTDGTTEASDDIFIAPIDLLASDITAKVDVAPGANDSYVIYFKADTVRVVGLTCTISGTGTECNSGTSTGLIAAGTRVVIAVDTGEGTGDPAAAASLEVSACIRRS